jgi:hypothetical protein
MEHEPAHVLLIEDNPGDADLVRLRLVDGKSAVQVNCVPRLADALACDCVTEIIRRGCTKPCH